MASPDSSTKSTHAERMEKIVSLCKRRGFIFQSSEIYGGINGFWDYGPLGAELKRNVKELWWKSMTKLRDDVVGLDASIIMHPAIWKASGHVDTFADPMVDCLLSRKRLRADQIEPQSGMVYQFVGALPRRVLLDLELSSSTPEFWANWLFPTPRQTVSEWAESLKRGLESQHVLPVDEATLQRAAELIYQQIVWADFSVLAPQGKPIESARKIAAQFFESKGVENPFLFEDRTRHQKVENTTRYNPENGAPLTEPQMFNLMLKTSLGAAESSESIAYLRPETAQAIFAQFKNVLDVSRQKIPFGIAQIGKAFRNEINPRNYTFRSREFEQMELEFFIKPDEIVAAQNGGSVAASAGEGHPGEPQSNWGWELWHKYWVEERMRWYGSIGLPRESLVQYWQKKDELAHYARATVDILYKFPFSKLDENDELTGEELEGIAARGDFDLTQHQKHSGKPLEYFDEAAKTKYLPHVIEPSAGVDRLLLALICQAYDEEEVADEKGKSETRVVMRFHPRVAPIKVGVFPLLKNKPELVKKALEVRDLLRPHMNVFYDETGAIGRRYRRQDEAGTPFGVTIDFETLGERGDELKDTVTLRHRDTMQQERIKIAELPAFLLGKIS